MLPIFSNDFSQALPKLLVRGDAGFLLNILQNFGPNVHSFMYLLFECVVLVGQTVVEGARCNLIKTDLLNVCSFSKLANYLLGDVFCFFLRDAETVLFTDN